MPDGSTPSTYIQYYTKFALSRVQNFDYDVEFMPQTSTSCNKYQPSDITATLTMALQPKLSAGRKINEYSLYTLTLGINSLNTTISSQMEVIEIIFQPASGTDFILDNCILRARDSLIQPVCSIVYFTKDACEPQPARTFTALKLGELRTLVTSTNIVFNIFAQISAITSINYRIKIYDWLGNLVGLSSSV